MGRRAVIVAAMLLAAAAAIAQDAPGRRGDASAQAAVLESARQFWASPSLTAFVRVGLALENGLISTDQQAAEVMTGQASRPRHPDFDKMKDRLAAGIIVSAVAPAPAFEDTGEGGVSRALKASPLPSIQRSFFGRGDVLFALPLRPFTVRDYGDAGALVDALSAAHGAAFTLRSLEPDSFAHFGHIGMWDVSGGIVRFDRTVTIHGLTDDGTPTGFNINEVKVPLGEFGCTGSSMTVRGRNVNARWTSAIVAWVGKRSDSPGRVSTTDISTRGKYGKRTVQVIDIDADGVPDFAVYAGVEPPVVQVETLWKMLFVNVDGAWVPFGFAQESDCT